MKHEAPLLVQMKQFAVNNQIALPVFNDVARQLQEASRSDTYDLDEIERSIDSDPALAAEVLRAANSAFFGGLAEISSIRAAIMRLGFKQVTNLAFMATEKGRYVARQPRINGMMKSLWQHASACALASEWIAKKMRYPQVVEEAFIGGLLHDIGKLYLLHVLDTMSAEIPLAAACPQPLVREILKQAHADQGYQLLQSWNLPAVYLTIVRDHHSEQVDASNLPLLMVRLANHACHKAGIGLDFDDTVVLSATTEATALGMSEVALAELEIILEDVQSLAA
jgi:putative nucleotidyltransferase with HDIG domain